MSGESYLRCLSWSPCRECDGNLWEFQPAHVEFQPVTSCSPVANHTRRPLQDWEVDQVPSWLGVRNNKDPAGDAVYFWAADFLGARLRHPTTMGRGNTCSTGLEWYKQQIIVSWTLQTLFIFFNNKNWRQGVSGWSHSSAVPSWSKLSLSLLCRICSLLLYGYKMAAAAPDTITPAFPEAPKQSLHYILLGGTGSCGLPWCQGSLGNWMCGHGKPIVTTDLDLSVLLAGHIATQDKTGFY